MGIGFEPDYVADYSVNIDNKAIGDLVYKDGYTIILGIFVHPDHRNQGLGTRVLKELHDKSEGIVQLHTYWVMQDAIKLYRKLGYDITEYDDWNVYMELRNGYK